MAKANDLFTSRKGLDEICRVPDKIISVYSLEKHVWDDSNGEAARKARRPELRTIDEFQIDPVRPFLNDIMRLMAAPYRPEQRDNPIGQGYWIQAEFGSGKSHLLCFLSALALGSRDAWRKVQEKEQKAGRGKRESLSLFWDEGLEAKGAKGKRGIFVIVRTLVGTGSGAIGLEGGRRRLTEYILDAAKEQLEIETGRNISLYPAELLADRFIQEDMERYRGELRKFLRDPRFFSEDEFEDVDAFLRDIQQNKSPEYKRSCGNKLWRFYTEYLKVQPQIAAESEAVLKHMVETILAEGYSGVLLVLDEVSLFMKNRDEDQRTDDEQTLVVLANRLAKIHNLPIWTVCAAQQAIESKMGVKNIIADDRLKLVKLLENDKDYYEIVLARVREIINPGAVSAYYLHYKRGFTWPASIGEDEFARFFPFHKSALEVLRAITYELTTTRSAIHFMHQTLKHQMKAHGTELIRLWELFDEAVNYEEEPSGVHAGLVAIKTKREDDYRAYEACRDQIEGMTKGYLKVHRDKAVRIIQTLFLVYLARTRQRGITAEEIANSVLLERDAQAPPDENVQHYETLAANLRKELSQVAESLDEDGRPRYRFDPILTRVDPRQEFRKARDEAESNQARQREAWEFLLALDEWPVQTRQMTLDLSGGVKSLFREIAPSGGQPVQLRLGGRTDDQVVEVTWRGRRVAGLVAMRNLARMASENTPLRRIDTDQTDLDFALYVSSRPASNEAMRKLLVACGDPRIMLWTPADLTQEERDRLLDLAAYRKLVETWGGRGKDSEDAVAVITWVANALQSDMGKIAKIVDNSFARGRIDALNNTQMDFHVAGEIASILEPLVARVLNAAYVSTDIEFPHPFIFRKEEGVKVINGIVRSGRIPTNARPDQNISAAQNFGYGLKIMRKGADRELDFSANPYVTAIWDFINDKLVDERQPMKVETLYKNFMGGGGPKDFGLTRRMVQIFLLCLVQAGKVRVGLGPRSGLPYLSIDSANLGSIDFSVKVLDALVDVQKVAKPENWEVLRPYAEKLLGEVIPLDCDDAAISTYRTRLRDVFVRERETSQRTMATAVSLFEALKTQNPYEREVAQVAALYRTDISTGDDITLLLHGLRQAMGYRAFDEGQASPFETDDLANRLRNYHDVTRFVSYEADLLAGCAYRDRPIPDQADLKALRRAQSRVAEKLARPQPYIDSEVRLRTDLLGPPVAQPGDAETIWGLIREYTATYAAWHDTVLDRLDDQCKRINAVVTGDELRGLEILEGVSALQPPVTPELRADLNELERSIFTCSSPSRASIQDQLRRGPIHSCGLAFDDGQSYVAAARALAEKAEQLVSVAVLSKMQVFHNPAIRERLAQATHEPAIAALLACSTPDETRRYLIAACLTDSAIIGLINRYLRRIVVKRVSLSAFRPSSSTVERGQVAQVVADFQRFLEDRLSEIETDGDTLPVLQIE
jgi:hypothetical protein